MRAALPPLVANTGGTARHAAGGPLMVIVRVKPDGRVVCGWWQEGRRRYAVFDLEQISILSTRGPLST